MAERTITLTLTPAEEHALSEVVALACRNIFNETTSADLFWSVLSSKDADALGRVNAALNGVR